MRYSKMEVGQNVRVLDVGGQFSRRGCIACCNEDGTFDILFSKLSCGNEGEESDVPAVRVFKLEDFEVESNLKQCSFKRQVEDWSVLKDEGNRLFILKDFEAAKERYQLILDSISEKLSLEISVGQHILFEIKNSIDVNFGIISEIGQNGVDIIYDDLENATVQEALNIPRKDIIFIPNDIKDRQLQRSAFMNLARCSMKQGRNGWAIKYCSFAIAIAQSIKDSLKSATSSSIDEDIDKQLTDSFFFRSKILLACNRPKFALKDCRRVSLVDSVRGLALRKEIEAHVLKQQKLNKKLARDIAAWVNTAMTLKEARDRSGEEDLPVESDDLLTDLSLEELNVREKKKPGVLAKKSIARSIDWKTYYLVGAFLFAFLVLQYFFHPSRRDDLPE